MDYHEEYVPINGTETYLLTYPAAPEKPVLLFLHGGPGSSESLLAYRFHEMLDGACTLAFYDQRGAGRTLRKSPRAPLSLGALLGDLDEIVHLLHTRYPAAPIVLMGHSWGTVLGLLYARRSADKIARYIGVGQVIDMGQATTFTASALSEVLSARGTAADRAKWQSLLPYPPARWDRRAMYAYMTAAQLREKYGLREPNPVDCVSVMRKSPIFQLRDIADMARGSFCCLPFICAMMNTLRVTDFDADWHVPALFLQGEHDFVTPLPPVQDYFARMTAPEKRLEVLADCGHTPMLDAPAPFFALVREQLIQAENEVLK